MRYTIYVNGKYDSHWYNKDVALTRAHIIHGYWNESTRVHDQDGNEIYNSEVVA